MPFQELSRRKRKDVKVEDIQVRVCLFAFDLLYLNGEVIVSCQLEPHLIHAWHSLFYKNLSRNEENSSTNTFSPYPANLALPSRLMANLRRKSSLSLRGVSKTAVKD